MLGVYAFRLDVIRDRSQKIHKKPSLSTRLCWHQEFAWKGQRDDFLRANAPKPIRPLHNSTRKEGSGTPVPPRVASDPITFQLAS